MICNLCPRRCGAERTDTRSGGVCGQPAMPVAARAMLHQWEEPCLVGEHGAGTVFFSGCNLRCCFCQNQPISRGGMGKAITPERLRQIFRELIDQGAACLDLVTPTHFTPAILEALGDEVWPVPVVWNCGGYEDPETLRQLAGRVGVSLPDVEYGGPGPAERESGHLLLPGEMENTRRCLDFVAEHFRPGEVLVSLMSQYTPQPGAEGNLRRHVTRAEYRAAVAYMENCGITDGYTQERTSAKEEYTPDFDGRGV